MCNVEYRLWLTTWWKVVMVPLVSLVAISASSTAGTPLATPTPTPDTKRPTNNAILLCVHAASKAPVMNTRLFKRSVRRLPSCSEGIDDTRQPTHAPSTSRAFVRETSTKH